MPATTKRLISLNTPVHAALEAIAATQKMDLNEVIQRALADFAWKEEALDEEDYKELKMTRELIDQAVQTALDTCARDGFRSDITYEAIKTCKQDAGWVATYRTLVGDDIYRNGNPRAGAINRQTGSGSAPQPKPGRASARTENRKT